MLDSSTLSPLSSYAFDKLWQFTLSSDYSLREIEDKGSLEDTLLATNIDLFDRGDTISHSLKKRVALAVVRFFATYAIGLTLYPLEIAWNGTFILIHGIKALNEQFQFIKVPDAKSEKSWESAELHRRALSNKIISIALVIFPLLPAFSLAIPEYTMSLCSDGITSLEPRMDINCGSRKQIGHRKAIYLKKMFGLVGKNGKLLSMADIDNYWGGDAFAWDSYQKCLAGIMKKQFFEKTYFGLGMEFLKEMKNDAIKNALFDSETLKKELQFPEVVSEIFDLPTIERIQKAIPIEKRNDLEIQTQLEKLKSIEDKIILFRKFLVRAIGGIEDKRSIDSILSSDERKELEKENGVTLPKWKFGDNFHTRNIIHSNVPSPYIFNSHQVNIFPIQPGQCDCIYFKEERDADEEYQRKRKEFLDSLPFPFSSQFFASSFFPSKQTPWLDFLNQNISLLTDRENDFPKEILALRKRIKEKKSPHEILGLNNLECTESEVNSAYKKICVKTHPDKVEQANQEEAKIIFFIVHEAKERVLKEIKDSHHS